jgi:hypothetical protein
MQYLCMPMFVERRSIADAVSLGMSVMMSCEDAHGKIIIIIIFRVHWAPYGARGLDSEGYIPL